jgi:hypothetical protein
MTAVSLPPVIDVLTLNVWGLPWPFSWDRGRRFLRIAEHFRANAYHVIGIQEAWWPLGARVEIPGLRLGSGRRDSGLGLAGTLLKGAGTELFRFDAAASADRLATKGLLLARVGQLSLAVTHLQAGDEPAIRRRQVTQLVEWLAGERGPVVLLGDFNFDASDGPSERHLADAGFRDIAAEGTAHPTFTPRNPFARALRAERFDRIYVRDGGERQWVAKAVRVLPWLWSDHQPVHAQLALV